MNTAVRITKDMPQRVLSIPAGKRTRAVQNAARGKVMRGHLPYMRGHVRVRVTLPAAEYRVFASAARLLARMMGAQAPDVETVMRALLGGRGPVDIVDGHLDSADWPLEEAVQLGRTI